jgi:hypothetical protein
MAIPQVRESQLKYLMAGYTLETYISLAINRQAELAVRDGVRLRSEDPAPARDLLARLEQMGFLNGSVCMGGCINSASTSRSLPTPICTDARPDPG